MKNPEKIVFGGGCFWCVEAVFQMLQGVESVVSGYTGGEKVDPTYHEVSAETTGHAEAVEITFDTNIVRLDDLLAVFFTTHDPTSRNRQGADVGSQYRSAIFYTTPEQRTEIENFIKKLGEEKIFSQPIVTEIEALSTFYPAESYHQNYYQKNQEQSYCQVVIDPKIAKLRQKFSHLLKS